MSDALGVGAFLESADGQVVFLKRGEHLAEAPGLWDIPGGHPEPQVSHLINLLIYSRCSYRNLVRNVEEFVWLLVVH
jgi:8-oxo-dGTP pyrophosphatase MutT (NUDIX family)